MLRLYCQVAAGLLLLFVSGCGTGPEKPFVPPMPTVRAVMPPRPVDHAAVLARAHAALERDDVAGAVTALQMLPNGDRSAAVLNLAADLAHRNPERAARFAEALPGGPAQPEALAIAAHAMMAGNRTAAVSWAFSLSSDHLRDVAIAAIAGDAVAADPIAGLQWIQSLPETRERLELLRLAAAAWAHRDPDAALQWVGTLHGTLREDVTASIGFELAQSTPRRAVAVASALPATRDRRLLFTEIAQTWIAQDPAAADAWVRGLPSGPDKDAALAGFAAATGPVGSPRSAEFTGAFAGSPMGGLAGVAQGDAERREFEQRLQESPATAAQWLSSVPSPEVSDDMLRRLAYEWFRLDPAAAWAWFRANVPAPSRRREILESATP
jgi:hypothetical protein